MMVSYICFDTNQNSLMPDKSKLAAFIMFLGLMINPRNSIILIRKLFLK